MIKYLTGDVYKSNHNIIFNPVGVRESNGFLKKVKKLYPYAYQMYHEMVWMYSVHELLGDIQLVQVAEEKFILNSFCIEKDGQLNKLALTKCLVELVNLAHEYQISVGIEYAIGVKEEVDRKWISSIIKEVFKGVDDIEVRIYDRFRK